MPRVLLVAYYFPPLGGIGSLRALGHASYLPEHGWDVEVLAPRSGAYHRDEHLTFPEDLVVRTASLELSRVGKKTLRVGGDDVAPARSSGVRARLRSAANAGLYFPDAQVGWAPFALRAGGRALCERPVDVVVSSSVPITAHVVARRLARDAGVPWVAEFRDPWSALMAPGVRRRRAARLERSLAEDASAVVMTSQSWADSHARLWGRPVEVIPNGHDLPALTADVEPDRFIIGYLGTYYPDAQASLGPVWAGLNRMADEGGARVDEIRVIGDLHPAMRAEIEAHGLLDRLRVTGFVSHAAAVGQLASCSLALLAGPADGGGIFRGHVPGKVWEYLATELPVVYVGAPDSDVARLLGREPGVYVISTADITGAVVSLRSALGRRHARDGAACSRRARAQMLARLLEHVVVESH